MADMNTHQSAAHRLEAVDDGSFQKLLCGMRAIGLKILKNKLSEYVRLAAGGETVLVTDRDRVVAELVPPREGRSALLADAQLAEAVRQGWMTPPTMVGGETPANTPIAPLRQLLDELAQDRGDR
jgi:antitoxin (DNA-binding transcriptional repressor) of toxin-antitoxin stability system